jgi:transcription antitermination factor NusG
MEAAMLSDDVRRQIEQRALEIIAAIEEREGKYAAEIVPDVVPQWHVVETLPGQEYRALQHLARRCIGVFMPKFDRDCSRKVNGVDLCAGRRLMFPGLLFVFVWDVETHWRRIKACPGVRSVLVDGAGCPVVVPDSEIDHIQALQYGLNPQPKTKRRRYRAGRGQADDEVEHVRISTYAALHGIERLADGERISALHRALGLAS